IRATAEEIPKLPNHRKEWINEAMEFIIDDDIDLQKKVKEFSNFKDNVNFEKLYEKVCKYFSKNNKNEEDDSLSNLALLDAGTNRGYGCAVFPVKRKTILEKDKNGKFIPVCTKNVFHKYYTQELTPNMTFWGEHDKTAYFADIFNKIEHYLTK
ncbi:MAG: DUF262 domain-containing protein, partial [Bacteroidales bacterium]|nr:DUF262 domain-containing protein [Bacteroidales bacterium]